MVSHNPFKSHVSNKSNEIGYPNDISIQLISGDHVGALAMSESGSGGDVVSMKLQAVRDGMIF